MGMADRLDTLPMDCGGPLLAMAVRILNDVTFSVRKNKLTKSQYIMFLLADMMTWAEVGNALCLKADTYEHAWEESMMYGRWMADNMWLFVPIQGEIQKFIGSLEGYPFQEGTTLNAGGINYQSLKAMKVLEHINSKGLIDRPGN